MARSPELKGFGAEILPNTLNYLNRVFSPEDSVLLDIRQSIQKASMPAISVGEFDGLHLEVLTKAFRAKKIVEIGTLGGYSGVCLLRGAGQDGRLYTFEYNPKHAEVAQKNFESAGLSKQVELFVGDAAENLSKIEKEGPFDLVFIDADKAGYKNYLNWAFDHLHIGGVVLGDNTLAWGTLGRSNELDEPKKKTTMALEAFNEACADRTRWRSTMLPTGEGLTLAVKIS